MGEGSSKTWQVVVVANGATGPRWSYLLSFPSLLLLLFPPPSVHQHPALELTIKACGDSHVDHKLLVCPTPVSLPRRLEGEACHLVRVRRINTGVEDVSVETEGNIVHIAGYQRGVQSLEVYIQGFMSYIFNMFMNI